MIRLPPISTLTDTLFPYTTLFLSILVKTFNLTVDKFPIAGATIGLERGALAFVVLAALLYFTASFILYYWIDIRNVEIRSEEHTSELQSLMRISYAVFCLKKKTTNTNNINL